MEHIANFTFELGYEHLLAEILTKYFIGIYTICRVLERPDLSVKSPASLPTTVPFVVVSEQRSLWLEVPLKPAIELGCTVFIVEENATISFLNKYISIHDECMFRRPEKFVIFALHSDDNVDLLKRIQNHASLQEIPNLLLIVPQGDKLKLMTHRYVGNPPGALDLLDLDTYVPSNRSFIKENNLFPDKLANLMGKTYKLASFHLLPWIMMRRQDDGLVRYLNQSHTIDGLDGYVLVQFCIWYNCTWDLSIDQEKQYGQVFDNNRTGNGMTGALFYRKADFALAAVGGWFQLFSYFSFSIPIQWIGITCLAPRPTLVPSWKIIFMMFTKTVWAVVVVTFILISFIENIWPKKLDAPLAHRKGLSWSFLNVLAAFLLLPSYLRRSRPSEIVMSLALVMGTFLIGYVYIGKIHSILAVPVFQPPIDTVIDLAESGLPWNAPHEVWMYLLKGSENPYILKLLQTFNVAPIPNLHAIADIGKEPLVMASLHNGHSMVGPWFTADNIENYRRLTEFLYYEYDTGYATKTWPLLDNFDYLSMWIRDACLFQYVELMEVFRYMDYRVQISIEHSRDKQKNELKPFGVEEVAGGLLILGFGYSVAAGIFIFELFTKAVERKRLARRLAAKWKFRAFAVQHGVPKSTADYAAAWK
ncbi:uncharacterized protein LOC129730396 [Wyeomyia smithii]|uniref:uncharacterized protein LOC129730396 n=1 Tax=Wyeomyia smithii TaxID=174621 RepID=UPI002467F11D|nr:uncharacterized protein LOC129730396 [Wyeomyia smithii]